MGTANANHELLRRFETSYERIITQTLRTLANLRKHFPMPGNEKKINETNSSRSPTMPWLNHAMTRYSRPQKTTN